MLSVGLVSTRALQDVFEEDRVVREEHSSGWSASHTKMFLPPGQRLLRRRRRRWGGTTTFTAALLHITWTSHLLNTAQALFFSPSSSSPSSSHLCFAPGSSWDRTGKLFGELVQVSQQDFQHTNKVATRMTSCLAGTLKGKGPLLIREERVCHYHSVTEKVLVVQKSVWFVAGYALVPPRTTTPTERKSTRDPSEHQGKVGFLLLLLRL